LLVFFVFPAMLARFDRECNIAWVARLEIPQGGFLLPTRPGGCNLQMRGSGDSMACKPTGREAVRKWRRVFIVLFLTGFAARGASTSSSSMPVATIRSAKSLRAAVAGRAAVSSIVASASAGATGCGVRSARGFQCRGSACCGRNNR